MKPRSDYLLLSGKQIGCAAGRGVFLFFFGAPEKEKEKKKQQQRACERPRREGGRETAGEETSFHQKTSSRDEPSYLDWSFFWARTQVKRELDEGANKG